MARPTVSLLELVRERRFSARNKRHRRKLLEDDSLIEFVEWNEDAPQLWRSLAEIQLRYRHDHGCLDRSYTAQGARSFESHLRLVSEDGEPLERAWWCSDPRLPAAPPSNAGPHPGGAL